MTVTINEMELIEHLDFDPENTCENKHGCDNKASWSFTAPCCKYTLLLCNECKEKVVIFLLKWAMVNCTVCGTENILSGEVLNGLNRL